MTARKEPKQQIALAPPAVETTFFGGRHPDSSPE
jgi:hypothetical protein